MDRRFQSRFDEMMDQAEVSPELLRGLLPRLPLFLEPFLQGLSGSDKKQRALEYTTGLLSGLEHKTGEGIAYLYDQDRQGIQKFIGQMPWYHQPLLRTLAADVGNDLDEPNGVIVFDPSAFPKKGHKSVGVARQWCGRLGKVDNCQVGIYMAYATPKEHAIVITRLYLPHEWTKDRKRAKGEAGLGDFQVRNWIAWHHHQTLSLLAAWFLNKETRRGKNTDSRFDLCATTAVDRRADRHLLKTNLIPSLCCRSTRWLRRHEQARYYHYRSRNILPPLKNQLRN